MSEGRISRAPHEVNRLTMEISSPFEDFRVRYEDAVPRFQVDRFNQLIKDAVPWDTVVRATQNNAPHDFIIYWSQDLSPLLRLAGHQLPCTEYLMGNHVLAERMYAHDPAVLLYAPLRTTIYGGVDGATRFTIDQPSTVFASFDNSEIDKVGHLLDHELAVLLDYLDAPVPSELSKA